MVQRLMMLIALWTAKVAWWLTRMLGRGKGSSLPGMIALKVYPDILKWFAGQPRKGTTMVTGTNGKTTTSNMLAQILSSNGYSVLANREGANLITGVATAFIRASNLWGKINCDFAVLEVDEAAFPVVSSRVHPHTVVVTNFFRDQLDRYGELDTTVRTVGEALGELTGVKLVLNADDPLVAQLKHRSGLKALYYGLDPAKEKIIDVGADAREANFCPFCGTSLHYFAYNYSQLGDFTCPGCGFKRPVPDVKASQVTGNGDLFRGIVSYRGDIFELSIPARGIYNYYNALAALSAALVLGIKPGIAAGVLLNYLPATGRMDRFDYDGKPLLLNLVKNPTGFNQALAALVNQDKRQDVLIAINDNAADGRDISWLWDVDFEVLEETQDKFASFICTGQRAEEMAVRLKYAGVSLEKIFVCGNMEEAVTKVISGNAEMGFLLATYTALWPVEAILSKKAKRVEDRAESLPSVS